MGKYEKYVSGNLPMRLERVNLKNEYGDSFMAINEACRTVVINERPFSIIHLIKTFLRPGTGIIG